MIDIGTRVAVVRVKRRGETTVEQPVAVTKVVRHTRTSMVTEDGRYWNLCGVFKASPTSRPENVLFITGNPDIIAKAEAHLIAEKEQQAQKQKEEAARQAWLQQPAVKMAHRLVRLSAFDDARLFNFWLCLGEKRLQKLISDLDAVSAFDTLTL